MPEPTVPAPLVGAIRDLLAWLDAESVPCLIVGGVAASILGRPRATRDVDALVLLEDDRWEGFIRAGTRHGIEPRRDDALEFAKQARVLLLRHTPTGIDLDIAIGALPFEEEAIRRGKPVSTAGIEIPLPTPEDLIVMKAVAHRPRDMADIESVLDATEQISAQRIREWVKAFAEALEMPEILEDLERILQRYGL